MADKILHKRNLSAGNVPTTSSLDVGELAINVADGKLFLRQSGSIANKIITVGESASFASTASFVTSSNIYGPYGANSIISASYALQALSSSYANFATSASHTLFAETASNALNAQDILVYVLNNSGYNIPKGTVVHITASGNSSDTPRIISASYENDANSANTLGIANESIANGANGYVMTEGVLKGIDTSAFVSGQMIYLGASGSIIGTAPQAPLHAVRLGQVVRVQQNNGSVYVRIDNGYELDELHDVRIMTASLQYGDLLMRSGSVWTNSKQLSGSYAIAGTLTATHITASDLYAGATYISGSLIVNGPSTFYGTASFVSVTASNLFVSESFISVNVFEPVERFGGLKVYDSGSSTATASLAWDSLHNHWVYQNVDGVSYTGGMLLSGPRNTGSLGDEPNLTKWFVPRSDGGDHLDNSQIYSSGSTTQVTGSLTVTHGVTASFTGSYAGDGSGLNNIPASGIVGLNLSQIASGSVSASISPDSGLQVNTNVTATSFTGSLFGTASWANNAITASFITTAQTASYVLSAISSSFADIAQNANTASFVQTAQTASYVLQAVSSSFATSSSFAATASFASTVPASGVIGLNLSQIATASLSASVTPTQFTITSASITEFTVTGTGVTIGNALTDTHSVTGSLNVTGSIVGNLTGTASFASTASYVLNAVSASFSSTASFVNPLTQNVVITGSLTVSSSIGQLTEQNARDGSGIPSISFVARNARDSSNQASYDWGNRQLFDSSGSVSTNWRTRVSSDSSTSSSIDWESRQLYDSNLTAVVDWQNKSLNDQAGTLSIDWTNRSLIDNGGLTSISWVNKALYDSTSIVLNWDATTNGQKILRYAYDLKRISPNVQEVFSDVGNYGFNYEGEAIEASLDAAVQNFDLIYLETDGIWYQNIQSNVASSKLLAICVDNTPGRSIILLEGSITVDALGTSGLAPYVQGVDYGLPIYIKESAGTLMSTSIPTTTGKYIRVLGHAYYNNATSPDFWTMKFRPSNEWYII